MSKIAFVANPNGTGVFSIAAPNSNTDRTLTLPDAGGEVLTNASNIEAQVKTAANASGSAPIYACRAWVNFNGTGTVAIRAAGNVSSVTDLGVGAYRINFATAMPDAFYSVVTSSTGPVNTEHCVAFVGSLNTTSVDYSAFQTNNSSLRADESVGMIAIFR